MKIQFEATRTNELREHLTYFLGIFLNSQFPNGIELETVNGISADSMKCVEKCRRRIQMKFQGDRVGVGHGGRATVGPGAQWGDCVVQLLENVRVNCLKIERLEFQRATVSCNSIYGTWRESELRWLPLPLLLQLLLSCCRCRRLLFVYAMSLRQEETQPNPGQAKTETEGELLLQVVADDVQWPRWCGSRTQGGKRQPKA